jgi:hypothetical protein
VSAEEARAAAEAEGFERLIVGMSSVEASL